MPAPLGLGRGLSTVAAIHMALLRSLLAGQRDVLAEQKEFTYREQVFVLGNAFAHLCPSVFICG